MKQLALSLVLIAGCVVGPDYKRPDIEVPQAYRGAPRTPHPASIADKDWADVFTDPDLGDLIRAALAQNQDVLIAAARIEQAEAQLGITRADQLPRASVGIAGGRERASATAFTAPYTFGSFRRLCRARALSFEESRRMPGPDAHPEDQSRSTCSKAGTSRCKGPSRSALRRLRVRWILRLARRPLPPSCEELVAKIARVITTKHVFLHSRSSTASRVGTKRRCWTSGPRRHLLREAHAPWAVLSGDTLTGARSVIEGRARCGNRSRSPSRPSGSLRPVLPQPFEQRSATQAEATGGLGLIAAR